MADAGTQVSQSDLVQDMRNLRRRMPRNMRELFELLSYYDPALGLDQLLDLLDFDGMTPAHVYNLVLNRPPEKVEFAIAPEGYDARQHMRSALLSAEFRSNVMRNFLNAFAEKARDVFIHVPKCAGTDLIFNLVRRSLPLPKMIEDPGWVSDETLLGALAGIARAATAFDRIFVYGHMELGAYVRNAGIRPIDRLFTIIRDPSDLLLSQANYAVSRLRQDPTGQHPDTAELLGFLGLKQFAEPLSDRDLKDLAVRALLDPRIARPNQACAHLGSTVQADYREAMTNLVTHDVEITTTRHYARWLQERWGLSDSSRHNQSEKILTSTEAKRFYGDWMQQQTAQDQMLFDVVGWALDKTGKSSVTGPEIARLAGPDLLAGLPQTLRAAANAEARRPHATDNLLAIQGPEFVPLYLEPPTASIPGSASARTVFEASFGAEDDGPACLRDGWARPEPRFTWTADHEAHLELPPVPAGAQCLLRLIGGPFKLNTVLPEQRVEVLLDGIPVGAARIKEQAVIECVIPSEVGRTGKLAVTLRLPDAARPAELGHGGDTRLLGLALERAMIVEVTPAAR